MAQLQGGQPAGRGSTLWVIVITSVAGFITALDNRIDALIVGAEHPLTVIDTPDGPSPRVAVRFGLEAELARPLYYELADVALAEGREPPGIWSDGLFFKLVP